MSIALAYLHPGTVTHPFMASVLQIARREPGLEIWPIRSGPDALGESRNFAVAKALDEGIEWLWFADTDVGFPVDMLARMLEIAHPTDRPVLTAPALAVKDGEPDGMGGFAPSLHVNLYEERAGLYDSLALPLPDNQLIRVDGCGAGMLLIHRSALLAVGREAFSRIRALSEDLSFCRRLANHGIPLHTHTSLRVTHHKLVPLI